MFYYRTYFPDEAIQSPEMRVGTLIHKVIEKYWNNEPSGLSYAKELSTKQELDTYWERIDRCLSIFYRHYRQLLNDTDDIERIFKVIYEPAVYIIGKLDRVTADHTI